MPVLLAALGSLLVWIAGSVVAKVIVALGLSVVYYRGISTALEWAENLFFSNMAQMPPEVLVLAGVLQVGTCVKIAFTAMGIRASLLGLTSDGFKRWVLK